MVRIKVSWSTNPNGIATGRPGLQGVIVIRGHRAWLQNIAIYRSKGEWLVDGLSGERRFDGGLPLDEVVLRVVEGESSVLAGTGDAENKLLARKLREFAKVHAQATNPAWRQAL
jgi:hypothetical protein